jgi:flagellar motor switch protein FliM
MEENIDISPEEIERIKRIYEEETENTGDERINDSKIRYQSFPFDQLERIDLSQLPLLEHALKVFSYHLKDELYRLGLEVSKVVKEKTAFGKYRQFMEHFEDDMFFLVFKIGSLPSYGALAFRIRFLFSLIGLLLGGEAEPPRIEKTIITPTEYKILEKFFNVVLKTLEKQLAELHPLTVEVVDTDTDKSLAKFNLTDKKVLISEFVMEFSESETENFYLIFDEETIEPLIPLLMGSTEEEKNYKKEIWKAIRTAEVPLKVILYAPPRTLEQILDWKVGDTLLLEEFANKPVKGYVGNNPVMEGYLGKHQGFYALMFLRWFKE